MVTRRTNIFASLRFVMIFYIVQGHFIQVATTSPFWLALFKQHNAVVGCFFLLSGFLLALGQNKQTEQISFWPFFIKRWLRIYPVYFVVLLLFSPMFIAVDYYYGANLLLEIKRAAVVFLLVQAWHPDLGLLWNSPTWFLSSLVFCYACFPAIMARVKHFDKRAVFLSMALVFMALTSIKIVYSVVNGSFFMEGLRTTIPYFDFVRFFPPINLLEFVLGILTGLLFNQADHKATALTRYAPVMLLLAICAIMIGRVYVPFNDMLTRTLLFTPLFLAFLYFVNAGHAKWLGIFDAKLWVFLGDISFSLYVIHGALGQVFYKKAVKTILHMPEVPYAVYLCLLFAAATLLHYGVELRAANLNQWWYKSRNAVVYR